MRTLSLSVAAILFATAYSAMAESKWLESKRLDLPEIKALCERVSDVRMLARKQISAAGDERWRRFVRNKNWLFKSQVWASPRSIPAAVTYSRALARPTKGSSVSSRFATLLTVLTGHRSPLLAATTARREARAQPAQSLPGRRLGI